MKVYCSKLPGTSLHRSPLCSQAVKIREIVEVDLDDIAIRPLCATCFSDAPRIKVLHAVCSDCGQRNPNPCRHNGGVQVMVRRDTGLQRRFVWPEEAWRYDLAPEAVRV